MRYLIFLLFLPSLLFSQTTKEYTKDIEGSGYANDGYYNYEAKIKYQLWNQGLGDIVLKIGIIDFKITRFRDKNMNEIYSTSSPVADQFPIVLNNHQADVRFNLWIEWKGGVGSKVVSLPNLKEEAVRQGSLDLYYFSKEQVEEMVDKFELKENRNNIEDLDVEMSSVYIDNDYFGDLASISDEYYKSKATSSKNSSSNNSSSTSYSKKSKKSSKKKKDDEKPKKPEKTYDQIRTENTYKANNLYNKLQNNSMSLSKRKKIINELKTYENYLTPYQKQKLQTQKTENALADGFVALSSIKLNDERIRRANLKVKYKNNSFNSYQFGAEFANAWNFFYFSVYLHGIYSTINGWEYDENLELSDLQNDDLIYTTGDGDDEYFKRNENIQSIGGGLELSMGVRVDLSNKVAITPYGIGELGLGSKNYSSSGFGAGVQVEVGRFTFGVEYLTSTYNFRSVAGSTNEILPPDIIPLTNLEFGPNGVIEEDWLSSTTNNNNDVIYRTNFNNEETFEFTKPKQGYFTFSLAFRLQKHQ